MKLSVVVPLLNERESLPELRAAIDAVMREHAWSYEIIFVDDGSSDGSRDEIAKLHAADPAVVKSIHFCRNYGKAAALAMGIDKAQGEIIVTMDADLQDDPVAIPEMVRLIEQDGFDLVSGWKKKRHDPVLSKNLPSKLFNATVSATSGVTLHDFNCGFKAYRSAAAKSLEIYGERHRFLPALAHWNGWKVTETAVPHHPRKFGKTKYGINRFVNGLFDLVTLLFLRKYMKNPMHFFGLIGLFMGLLGTSILAYFGVEWIVTREMHIRPLLLLAVGALIMGIQFVSIGLIGELITSMGHKGREYQVREVMG